MPLRARLAELAAAVAFALGRDDRCRTRADRRRGWAAEVAAVGKMIEDTPQARENYADGLRVTVALSVGFAILVVCCASSAAGRSTT